MTTKPSSGPWADQPFRLIPTPSETMDGSKATVYCASAMAHAHNTLIRGLNSIVQQAPFVPDASSETGYVPQDVKDLMAYVRSWVKMVNHHHSVEEDHMFPAIEERTGKPGLLSTPRDQHELFHDGMQNLLTYVTDRNPDDYCWEGDGGMKQIIESFSKPLLDHLYAEIDIFLGLENVDPVSLKNSWDDSGEAAKKTGTNLAMMYEILPMVLGCVDKTYESGHDFPPFPLALRYLVKYWFARGNGAWRFNPCDLFGKPQPLHWVPSP